MKISVIMPVYNGEKYLNEAIDSILCQTFYDFEFIIINDSSTDNTENIIKSYNDERIVYIKNETNLGVAGTLNVGLKMAKGEYIARMDADDISLPNRFETQINFMENNPDVAVIGSSVEFIGSKSGIFEYSETIDHSKIDLIFCSCLAHPSVVIRKSVIDEGFLYDNEFDKVEDYYLWIKISEKYKLCSLKDVLVKYRIHENQITQNYSDEYKHKFYKVKKYQLDKMNVDYTDDEIFAYFSYCINEFDVNIHFVDFCNLLNKIFVNNIDFKVYNQKILKCYFANVILGCTKKYDIKLSHKFIKKLDYLRFIDYFKFKLITMIKG